MTKIKIENLNKYIKREVCRSNKIKVQKSIITDEYVSI